jgi:hypothetical protein
LIYFEIKDTLKSSLNGSEFVTVFLMTTLRANLKDPHIVTSYYEGQVYHGEHKQKVLVTSKYIVLQKRECMSEMSIVTKISNTHVSYNNWVAHQSYLYIILSLICCKNANIARCIGQRASNHTP